VAGNVEVVYSPEYEISRTNANAQACLRQGNRVWDLT
jgi:hypothetical protein